MNLDFTEEQRALQEAARKFLEKECPASLVRAVESGTPRFPKRLWKQMAELGWLGLAFGSRYGGTGSDLVTLAALLEELGRACDPTPYFSTVVVGGLLLQDAADDACKADLLPRIAAGDVLVSLALSEEDPAYGPHSLQLRAHEGRNGFVLAGTKLFVEHADLADYFLVAARTQDGPDRTGGATLLLVDAHSRGVSLTPMPALISGRLFEVTFRDAVVPSSQLLGERHGAWPALDQAIKRTAALQCAAAVGGARRVLEMTVDYAKTRVQFGAPIGTFQAVQHHCANMWMDVETAWLATYEAISLLAAGIAADAEVALAKAWTSEAYTRTCLTAHQIHGGVGFMMEYDLQLWTRQAKTMELMWGTPGFHRQALAAVL